MKICNKCKAVNLSKANFCKFCASNIKNASKAPLLQSLKAAIKKKDKEEFEEDLSEENAEQVKKLPFFKKLLEKKDKKVPLLEQALENKIKNLESSPEKSEQSQAALPNKTFPDLVKIPSNFIENDEDLSKINFDEAVKRENKIPQNNLLGKTDSKDDKELLKNIIAPKLPKMEKIKAKKKEKVKINKEDEEIDIQLKKKEKSLFFKIIDVLGFFFTLVMLFLLIYYLKEDLYLLEDIFS